MKRIRTKTISKNYYDDEILFKDTNGDIHLKEEVHRLNYPVITSDYTNHINYWDLAMRKIETFNKSNKNWDND